MYYSSISLGCITKTNKTELLGSIIKNAEDNMYRNKLLQNKSITVVDSYDAMTEDRPYRRAMTKEAAINEIKNNAGTQFDPEIAKIFIDIIKEDYLRSNN